MVNIDLLKLKKDYERFDIILNFLEKLTINMKEVSQKSLDNNSLIFIDYLNKKEFFVNVDEANKILKTSYDNYYLKIILIDLIKMPSFDLIKKEVFFFFFFKSLFIATKNGINRKIEIDAFFLYKSIINLAKTNNMYNENYDIFVSKFLKSFELNNFINKVTYFLFVSYETFRFTNKEEECCSFSRYNTYFDLLFFLEYPHIFKVNNKNDILDRSLQHMILICFKRTNFIMKYQVYNDNSFIKKRLDSYKNYPQLEKTCQHFNNL